MNSHGQAAIEAIVIGGLLVILLFFSIRFGLMIQQNLLIDAMLEESLICFKQNKSDCADQLRKELRNLHFTQIEINFQSRKNIVLIKLKALSAFGRVFEKESELLLDLSA